MNGHPVYELVEAALAGVGIGSIIIFLTGLVADFIWGRIKAKERAEFQARLALRKAEREAETEAALAGTSFEGLYAKRKAQGLV